MGMAVPVIAQQEDKPDAAAAWQIQSSPFGQQSFYAIKHNVVTGETLVLSAEKGVGKKQKWMHFGVEDGK